jgi:hypothetical protein
MTRSRALAVLALVLFVAALLLTPSGQVLSQRIEEVFVVNFPAVQTVDGTVQIKGAVRLSQTQAFENITVPPVKPTETTRLVEGGVLQADGFPNVVLSLHGIVRGEIVKPGEVGAILIPTDQRIQAAFDEQGLMLFGLQTVARDVNSKTAYFASDQPSFRIGFPRYNVLLYNTTDKTVELSLNAYLTN